MSLLVPLVLALAAGLAMPDSLVTIGYAPVVGERQRIEVENVRQEYRLEADAPVLVDRVRQAWVIESEVVARRPPGYALAWTYRADREGEPSAMEPRLEPVTGTLVDVRIRFAVDTTGSPTRVLNPGHVRRGVARGVEAARPRADPGDRPRLDALAQQAQSDAGLRALVLSNVERYHLVLGHELQPGQTRERTADIRNPFGAGNIPAVETLRLDSLSASGDVAHVSWALAPDPVALARIVLDLLEEFDPGAVQLTPDELAEHFLVREEATFEVEHRSGRVRLARFERRVQTGDRQRVERTTFRLRERTPDSP